jgi:ABC-type multidrug transport system fused ATPase/permease subunit
MVSDNLKAIIKKHKWRIALIYTYVFIAQCLFLVEPYLLGKAIDQTIHGEYYFLFLLLGVFIAENLFMYRRMVYDTKVYTDIYNEIVIDYLERDHDSDTSTKIARTDMAYNLINFLENDLHYLLMSVMSIIGSLYFIFAENALTGIVVLFCIAPVSLIVKLLYKKIAKATRVGNTHYEQKSSIMQTEDMALIENFYKRRKKVIVASSTLQGKNWAALNSVKSAFLIIAVIVFTGNVGNITQGSAVSMYAYINQFLISVLSIPISVEIFTRIKDVLARINC